MPLGAGGLLTAPTPGPTLSSTLASGADDYTWAAAAMGSNNAAGYQLGSGAPVMAIGGFNGTDPAPTLDEFKRYVADKKIHYFIRGQMMIGQWGGRGASGSREAAEHRRLGRDPLHADHGRQGRHLRPDSADEEHIACA